MVTGSSPIVPFSMRPPAARAPHRVALEAFAARVQASDAGVVEHRHRRRFAVGIGEDLGLVGGLLELARHAHAQRRLPCCRVKTTVWSSAVSVVMRSMVRDVAAAAEDEARGLAQQRLAVGCHPVHLDGQLAAIGAALGLETRLW